MSITSGVGSATHGAGTVTLSHTVAAGDNRLLVVGLSLYGDAPGSVTYGGAPMTQAGRVADSSGYATEIWYLLSPTVGTADVVVSMPSGGALGATCLYGVHQTTPIGTYASRSGWANIYEQWADAPSDAYGKVVEVAIYWDNTLTLMDNFRCPPAQLWDENVGADPAYVSSTAAICNSGSSASIRWEMVKRDNYAVSALPIIPVVRDMSLVIVDDPGTEPGGAHDTIENVIVESNPFLYANGKLYVFGHRTSGVRNLATGDYLLRCFVSSDDGYTWTLLDTVATEILGFSLYRSGDTIYFAAAGGNETGFTGEWFTLSFNLVTEEFSSATSLGSSFSGTHVIRYYYDATRSRHTLIYTDQYDLFWWDGSSERTLYSDVDACTYNFAGYIDATTGKVYCLYSPDGVSLVFSELSPETGTFTAAEIDTATLPDHVQAPHSAMILSGGSLYAIVHRDWHSPSDEFDMRLAKLDSWVGGAPTLTYQTIVPRGAEGIVGGQVIVDAGGYFRAFAWVADLGVAPQFRCYSSSDGGATWTMEVIHDEGMDPVFPTPVLDFGVSTINAQFIESSGTLGVFGAWILMGNMYDSREIGFYRGFTLPGGGQASSGHFAYFGNPVGFGASAGGWFL